MIKTILSPFDHYPLQLELGEDFLPSQNPNLKLKQNNSRPQHPNHSYPPSAAFESEYGGAAGGIVIV